MDEHKLNRKNLNDRKKLHIPVVMHWLLGKCEYYPDGVPCIHNGCMNHRTHKCEYCGRIESRGYAHVPIATGA